MDKMSPKKRENIDENIDAEEPIKSPEKRSLALYISFWGLVCLILLNAFYDRNIEKGVEHKYDGVYKIGDDHHSGHASH